MVNMKKSNIIILIFIWLTMINIIKYNNLGRCSGYVIPLPHVYNEIYKKELFKIISKEVKSTFEKNNNLYTKIRTKNGKTQEAEYKYIDIIENIIKNKGLSYRKAKTQEPYDFQNVGNNIGIYNMNIKVKKTDRNIIKCNDTCPSDKCYYIIILTKYKKIISMRGDELLGEYT